MDEYRYLLVDPVDLPVLTLDLVAHVDGHVAKVADHVGHFADVLLHLVLASVVRYPASTSSAVVTCIGALGTPQPNGAPR